MYVTAMLASGELRPNWHPIGHHPELSDGVLELYGPSSRTNVNVGLLWAEVEVLRDFLSDLLAQRAAGITD